MLKETQTKVEHTPGPWHLIAGPPAFIRVVNENADTLARLYRDDVPDWRTNEANARLIAAAPELLAALKAIVEHIDREGPAAKEWKAISEWCERGRAARAAPAPAR